MPPTTRTLFGILVAAAAVMLIGAGVVAGSPGPASAESSAPCSLDHNASKFKPTEASPEVDAAIREAVARYNLPRWFYYAIIQRESSFDPKAVGPDNDLGLTQMRGVYYTGTPYPMGLAEPDDGHRHYGWDMNFPGFGRWISMTQVSPLSDPFDPRQNLERFSTGYAVPAFHLFKRVYGLDDEGALRAVAFHWNKGVYRTYNPANADYLALYDKYAGQFRGPVEDEDGAWDGLPVIPSPDAPEVPIAADAT